MQCQAKSKRTGEQCKAHAVTGFRHCRMHGGVANNGRPPTHGRYSKALEKHPDILALYEEAKADPNLTETLNEIALMRAKLQHFLQRWAPVDNPEILNTVKEYTDAISKLVERREKILHGERVTLTVEHTQAFVARVLDLVGQIYGSDDERYATLLTRLDGLYSPGADSPTA